MPSKLTFVCVMVIIFAYFERTNAACQGPCENGWYAVGSWCVQNAANVSTFSDALSSCPPGSLLSTDQWSATDLNALDAYISEFGSNLYVWDNGFRSSFDPNDAAATLFIYSDGNNLPCISPRFCNGQCHNGLNDVVKPLDYSSYTHLFYRVKNGVGCVYNSPEGFYDIALCQKHQN